MPILLDCPSCSRKLRVPDDYLGRNVKCPNCGTTFLAQAAAPPPKVPTVPEAPRPSARPAAPPPPEHVAPRPSRRPAAAAPRDDFDFDGGQEVVAPRGRKGRSGLPADYRIDMNEWFDYAKEHYTSVLGALIGWYFVTILVCMIPLVGFIVGPPLAAGGAIICLAQLKGKPWTFGDSFSGFQWFGALFGWVLIQAGISLGVVLVCLLPALLVAIIASVAESGALGTVAILLLVVGGVAATIALLYIGIRASMFGMQLIVDRGMGAVEAIKANWELSKGHFWGLLGMSLLIGLIAGAGSLACGFGMLFTMPFAMLMQNAGYLLIAGSRPPRRLAPAGARDYDD